MLSFFSKVMMFIFLCGAIVCVLATPSRAQEAESTPAPDDQKPLLYGIHVGQDSDFWRTAGEGAKAAADELGYTVLYRGGAQTDTELQRKLFDIALQSGAKGIFIAPNSADRSEDIVKAKALNIPVVYFDRTMGDKPPITSFIGTNNYAAGEMAGEEMIKKLGKDAPAKIVVFRMSKDVVPTTEREDGFIDAVTKAGYEVVAEPYITSEIGEARARINAFLSDPTTPSFDAFFTSSEYCSVAAILTLQMMGNAHDYVHIGFDGGDTIEKSIRDGEMYGTIVQQPFQMGYHSVKALDEALHGRPVKAWIESDALFVSKDNVDTYKN